MGYGIDRSLHFARCWSSPIQYTVESEVSPGAVACLEEAMRCWSHGTGIGFCRVRAHEHPRVVRVRRSDGENKWNSGDGRQGMNPGSSTAARLHNVLLLKENSDLNTMIHEVGHLLGLAHEHDRPDDRDAADYRHNFFGAKGIGMANMVVDAAIAKRYKKYGPFDPDSVMIYGMTSGPKPSTGDIETVRAIYDL